MNDSSHTSSQPPPAGIDTSVSHSARVWNYWLGGKDNYPVDHEAGEQVRAVLPGITDIARASRAFLARAIRYLAGEIGIRQFLDIGTGLPTANNTHEIAQAIAPECRIVYVDNDPLVLTHARALLTSTPDGVTDYLDADLHEPDTILAEASRVLDFTHPIGLVLLGIVQHILDTEQAYAVVHRLLDALPSGSYLVLADPGRDGAGGEAIFEASNVWNESGGKPPVAIRSLAEITRFFDGVELLEPGVVSISLWRPDPCHIGSPAEVSKFGGVGRKA